MAFFSRRRATRVLALALAISVARGATLGCDAAGRTAVGATLLDAQYYALDVGDACAAALLAGGACAPPVASPLPVLDVLTAQQAGVSGAPSVTPYALEMSSTTCVRLTAPVPVPAADFTAVLNFLPRGAPSAYTLWSGPNGQKLSVAGASLVLTLNGTAKASTASAVSNGRPTKAVATCAAGVCSVTSASLAGLL